MAQVIAILAGHLIPSAMRETMLIVHFLGLAMGVGTSFAFMFLGIAAGKLEPEKRREFMLNAFALSKMGHIGVGLLILSGAYLIIPYWAALADMPLLLAKLALVLVVMAVVIINGRLAREAKNGGDAAVLFPKMGMVGRVGLLSSITIIVLAVLIFR